MINPESQKGDGLTKDGGANAVLRKVERTMTREIAGRKQLERKALAAGGQGGHRTRLSQAKRRATDTGAEKVTPNGVAKWREGAANQWRRKCGRTYEGEGARRQKKKFCQRTHGRGRRAKVWLVLTNAQAESQSADR